MDEQANVPASIVDNDMLKHFAEEAEVCKKTETNCSDFSCVVLQLIEHSHSNID